MDAGRVRRSTPVSRWIDGKLTGGLREAVWADTKRGDALAVRNSENETMRSRSDRSDALSVRSEDCLHMTPGFWFARVVGSLLLFRPSGPFALILCAIRRCGHPLDAHPLHRLP